MRENLGEEAIDAIVAAGIATEDEAVAFMMSKDGERFVMDMIEVMEEGLSAEDAASEIVKAWSVPFMTSKDDRGAMTYIRKRIAAAL